MMTSLVVEDLCWSSPSHNATAKAIAKSAQSDAPASVILNIDVSHCKVMAPNTSSSPQLTIVC